MTDAIRTIGFIGLGVMGGPMCANLLRRGRWPVIAFDLSPDRVADAAAEGARAAASAEALANEADLIITCLPGGDQVRALMLSDGGLLSRLRDGQIYVDMSTAPPDLMREIAAAAPKGVRVADAPVARTRTAAAEGELLIMVGCEADTLDRIAPVMETMGSDVVHCGGSGAGQVAKILNNMVLFETVAALAEAVEIGDGAGLDADRLLDVLSLGSADSFALRAHGRKSLATRDYPEAAFSVRYAAKDLSYARHMAAHAGVDAPGAAHVAMLFERAVTAGDGDRYFPVIRERLRPTRKKSAD